MSSKESEMLKAATAAHAKALDVRRATPEPHTESAEEAALDRRSSTT